MTTGLRFGPLGADAVHLCIDMQTLFAERTDWHVPWLERVLPTVIRLAEARPERTLFTRFIPPQHPEDAQGAWRRYYAHWRKMTGEALDPRLIRLVPPLAAFAPPATVIDKACYSPFKEPTFLSTLRRLKATTLIITGGETDVCVLGAVMDAVIGAIARSSPRMPSAASPTNPTMRCCGILHPASASRSKSPRPMKFSPAGAQGEKSCC